ncbi:hypothetical protein KSX_08060 [Ktedonospora formicarum]|uniref:Uncharacterized protein n=1 Tax=Ktedonospora formicarum TaxID=2778364 RepID=A0A8J3MQI9_9CHLR|nr:hypothetical protein KSX_08060 [Ktedonospora formicarum]
MVWIGVQYVSSREGKTTLTGRTDFLPVLSVGVIGACAADVYESRQVREEAAVSGPPWVT